MSDARERHEASFAANERLWDAWTAVHATGDFYDLEAFRAGGVRLRPYEIELVGDVTGKTLLHLQCHFGIDTLRVIDSVSASTSVRPSRKPLGISPTSPIHSRT